MSEEQTEEQEPASEVQENDAPEVAEEQQTEESEEQGTQVPLSALQAERKKRQEYESRLREYEQWIVQQQAQQQAQTQSASDEDDDVWMSRGDFKQEKNMTKREILEEVYCDSHPERVQEITNHLETIIQRKPWLGETIANAPNRYARAWEIIRDYNHLVEPQQQKSKEAKKMVQNSKKPGSPANVGKSSQQSQQDFLLSMRGKKEFNEYRKKLLGRR